MKHNDDHRKGLSREDRMRILSEVWNEIHDSGYTGAADRVALEEIERAVTESLYWGKSDVDRAESLTFKALHLIAGNIES